MFRTGWGNGKLTNIYTAAPHAVVTNRRYTELQGVSTIRAALKIRNVWHMMPCLLVIYYRSVGAASCQVRTS